MIESLQEKGSSFGESGDVPAYAPFFLFYIPRVVVDYQLKVILPTPISWYPDRTPSAHHKADLLAL